MEARLQSQQTANDALMGDVQTLHRDMNRLLERIGSLTTAIPQPQPLAVDQAPAPPEVVEVRDTQAMRGGSAVPPPQVERLAAVAA